MKKMNSEFSFALSILVIVIVGALMLTGCSGLNINGAHGQINPANGAATVGIHMGKVGMLAKQTNIEMSKLIIEIKIKDSLNAIIRDTSALIGHNESIVKKTFPGLAAPENFTLFAKAFDKTGKVIHSGSKNFLTLPADTVTVSLDLDAQYSMLRVSFGNIPDSVKKVTLGIAAVDTLDSTFAVGSRDTVILAYDYLTADTIGVNHAISLRASGSFYRKDTVLYAADTTVSAASGVDKSYKVVMKWVGPGVPKGAATMTVTIGAIGAALINSTFEGLGGIPTAGLTAYYPFNGNANDMSMNGINGTIHGATLTNDRFGKSNSAYAFNGTSNYIDLGTSNPVTGDHFTLSAWIMVGDTATYPSPIGWYAGYIIAKGDDYGKSGSYGLQIANPERFGDGSIHHTCVGTFVNTAGDTIGRWASSEEDVLKAGKWHHVVGIHEGYALRTYLDGNLVANSSTVEHIFTTTLPLYIGRKEPQLAGYESFFKGIIDDVRIYDRSLTELEVQSLFHENGWNGNP